MYFLMACRDEPPRSLRAPMEAVTMAETLGCVGADLGLPDPRGAAFFLGLLGAEDAAAVAAGTWLVSSDMSLLNCGATREMRPKTAGCYCKERNSRGR